MSDKDELLLSIVEKMADQVSELKDEMVDLKIEQARQGVIHAVNSKNFEEHMARTAANEKRVELVEKHVLFVNSALKVVSAIGALTLFLIKVVPFAASLIRR